MKSLSGFAITWVVLTQAVHGQGTKVISDYNRELLKKQEQSSAYKKTPIAKPQDIPTSTPNPSLTERIVYLTDGSVSVMIPRGAVIHLPKGNRISQEEKSSRPLVEWEEFFLKNRNAIRLEPVNVKQLQGLEGVSEKNMTSIKTQNLPTLTSYQNTIVALPALKKTTTTTP